MQHQIKHIIFDFGGVLLELDAQRSFLALASLIDEEIELSAFMNTYQSHFHDFEKGKMGDESFIWKFQNLSKKKIEPREIIDAWNAMLLDIRPEIFSFLRQAKEKHRIYILSNTNSIHIQYVMKHLLAEANAVYDWPEYFDHIFYSHEIGMRKPDREIFDHVVKSLEINPQEILFIDDLEDNVLAAKAAGWHAIQHDPSERIEEKLNQYIAQIENH